MSFIFKMKLKTSVEKIDKNKIKIDVEVSHELFKEDIEKAYKKISKSLKIPGFRKGNIPKKIIDTRVSQDYILNEALEESILKYYLQAVSQSKVKPVIKPEIKVEQLEKGKSLRFIVKVLVEPEVLLKKYKGIKLKKRIARVGEKEIKSHLEGLRNQFARLEDDKNQVVKKDIYTVVDIECYLDDKLLNENTGTDYLLQVGSGASFGDKEKELIGMRVGDKKILEVIYPENYSNKKIAGKKLKYHIKIKAIKKKLLPEVNDEFAKMVGGFDNLDELKKYIKNETRKKKKEDIESSQKIKILEELIKYNPIDIPHIMIENRNKELIDNFKQNLTKQGSSLEDFLKMTNQDKKSFEKIYKKRAEQEISHNLILDAVSEKESIKVSDEVVKSEAKRIASYAGDKKDDVYNYYIKGIGYYDLKVELRRRKTLDFLLANAKIV